MNKKSFEFHGTAGGYFVVFLVTLVTTYIPLFGWPIAMNYGIKWIADNLLVDGRKVQYNAEYGETLWFIFVNILLLFFTLGIYIFWFVPKQYRFILDHCSYVDEDTTAPAVPTPSVDTQPLPPTPTASV